MRWRYKIPEGFTSINKFFYYKTIKNILKILIKNLCLHPTTGWLQPLYNSPCTNFSISSCQTGKSSRISVESSESLLLGWVWHNTSPTLPRSGDICYPVGTTKTCHVKFHFKRIFSFHLIQQYKSTNIIWIDISCPMDSTCVSIAGTNRHIKRETIDSQVK